MLNDLTRELSNAKKVTDTDGLDCTPVDPKDIAHRVDDGTGGLDNNEYVCYNKDLIEQEYLKCPPTFVPPPVSPPASPPVSPPVSSPTASPPAMDNDSSSNAVSYSCLSLFSMLATVLYFL